jgi:biopolymer transport protein ExbD
MVTAKLIVTPPKAMNLDLPRAATGTDVQEILSVVLYANGQAEVNGVAMASDDAVLELASSARSRNLDLRVVIQADGAVAHRRVMRVLDQLKLAGLAKVTKESGYGFAREAQRCALHQRWSPALNHSGTAVPGSTTVNVRFDR